MAEMVRLGTRVSTEVKEWLEMRSEKTGVPISTIVFLALEEYRKSTEVINMMGDIGAVLQKLDKLEQEIKQK